MTVAVVGAGLSGLVCATTLRDQGHTVRVLDKGRGPGGRMSTRRANGWHFDHGAQYFTVRDPQFASAVEEWRRAGSVAPWEGVIAVLGGASSRTRGRKTERFVGVPGMNAVCAKLASDLDVEYGARVQALENEGDLWRVVSIEGDELGRYEAVIVSAPAPQTAALLADVAPLLGSRAAEAVMAPCWAVMASFDGALDLGFDGAFVHDSPLSWVARNSSKPARDTAEAWVLHASPDWSAEHVELERAPAAVLLFEAFGVAVGGIERDPVHLDAHRWRYALPTEPLPEPCLFDERLRLAACGDWCDGPRVEGAYLSGLAAAARIATLCA